MIVVLRRHPLLVFFILVFLIGWLIQLFARIAQEQGDQGTWTALLVLFTLVPGIVAVILVYSLSDHAERSAFWRRLFTWRTGIGWYGLAFIIGAGPWLAGAGLTAVLGTLATFNPSALAVAPILLITVFVEEVGWRGFALPHFLSRYLIGRSGLLLGIVWAIWHAPDYLREPFDLYAALFATLTVVLIAQSIIMTWIFRRTGGILLPVILLHWMSNTTANVFYSGDYTVDAITTFLQVRIAAALVLVIVAGVLLIREGGVRAITTQNELLVR